MNATYDEDREDLRYAEYALGVLEADERVAVESEVREDERAAVEVARWQERLTPLAEDFPSVTPADYMWTRIRASLNLAETRSHLAETSSRRLGESLSFWRWLALGTSAVAAACVIALAVLLSRNLAPNAPHVSYMASTIIQDNGQVGWTATMDLQHARMVVVPAKPQALPAGRAPELWLIPAGQKPIAVGMIAAGAPTAIRLDSALLARLGPTAALAVSVEPPGGSPSGQPTGPVIAKGAIGAASESGGNPVAMLARVERVHATG